MGTPRQADWPLRAAIVLAVLGPLVATSSYFPAQDEPNHLFTYHALQELSIGGSFLHRFFFARLAGHVTYIAVERLVLALARILPLAVADRAMVMLLIVAFPLSVIYFLRKVSPGTPFVLVAPILAFNWLLHMGFWNQLYGYVAMFLVLGYAIPRLERLRVRGFILIGFLFVVLTVVHPLVLVFSLGVLGLCALVLPPAGSRARALGRVMAAAAPALILFAWASITDLSGNQMVPVGEPYAPVMWQTIPRRVTYFFGRIFFSLRPSALPVVALLFGLLVVGVLSTFAMRNVRRAPDGAIELELGRRDVMLGVAGLCYMGYLLVPETVGQPLSCISERLPLLTVIFLVAWLPTPGVIWRRRLVVALTGAAAFLLVENFLYVRQWNQVLRGYTSAEDRVSPGARVLPVFFDTVGAVPAPAFPMVQAWAYYAVSRDAVGPYSFAYQPHTAIGFLRDPYVAELPNPGEYWAESRQKDGAAAGDWRPDVTQDQERADSYHTLLDYGRRYDYVLTWRAPDAFLAEAAQEGFTTEVTDGHMCLLLPPGKSDPPPQPMAEVTPAVPWNL
jgi:hypothetical protein